VRLWHDETIQAMTTARSTVVPELLQTVEEQQLNGAGFLGLMAQSESYVDKKQGISVFNEETDSEVTVTARTLDGKASGWGGQAARNWATVNGRDVATRAVHFATLGANPVALEPGRRTAILGAPAVAQIVRFLDDQFRYDYIKAGQSGFSRLPRGDKRGQRVFDPRINMTSDPADPDGGYRPWQLWEDLPGISTPNMSYVENGVLKILAYRVGDAIAKGKPHAQPPHSLRVFGGPTSVDEMITRCEEGVYVNRFSSVGLVDRSTGLLTGVTRDGCFFVKHGKIEKAVKNFRFVESPFFFLNKLEAIGAPARQPLGYTPPTRYSDGTWPLSPIIVPPMMVRDFNFAALADAV
jgi:predicted Zn-dependent protease